MKIESDADHEKAISRLSDLMDIETRTDAQDTELDALAIVIEAYEESHFNID